MNVDHVVPIKKFEKGLNNFDRAVITKQPIKNRCNTSLQFQFQVFVGSQSLSKRWTSIKIIFERFSIVNYKKPPSNTVCWECVAEKIWNALMSKIIVSI